MYVLIMLVIVVWVAARAVALRRRGTFVRAAVVATALVAGTAMLPDLLEPSRAPSLPSSLARFWIVCIAIMAGTGFLALGALAKRRAHRDASMDAERMPADAVAGTAAWIAGATIAGLVLGLLLLSSIGMMAP